MKTPPSLFLSKIIFTIVTGLVLCNFNVIAQDNVGIGTLSPAPSAILDLFANDKGFLLPRLTTTQMAGIASPAEGLTIYNTSDSCIWFYSGASGAGWKSLCDTFAVPDSAWLLKGNAGTNPAVNFMGTTDNAPVVFKTNNNEVMRLDVTQNVGIGTPSPAPSAIFEAASVTKGVLIPRTDTNAVEAVFPVPATGLLIYQATDSLFYYFDGIIWRRLGGGNSAAADSSSIYEVMGTLDDSINSTSWTDLSEMTLTVTPSSGRMHVSFTASGQAITGVQQRADFRILKDGIPVVGANEKIRDYSIVYSLDTIPWEMALQAKVTVTPYVPTVFKVQWKMKSLNGTGVVHNLVATDPDGLSHRSLRVEE